MITKKRKLLKPRLFTPNGENAIVSPTPVEKTVETLADAIAQRFSRLRLVKMYDVIGITKKREKA